MPRSRSVAVAQTCLNAAHSGSMTFPTIVAALIKAGFEAYTVDYRRRVTTYFLPDGDSVTLDMQPFAGNVAAAFDAAGIERLVRWAQANPADYSYVAFSEKAKAAGCAAKLNPALRSSRSRSPHHRRRP